MNVPPSDPRPEALAAEVAEAAAEDPELPVLRLDADLPGIRRHVVCIVPMPISALEALELAQLLTAHLRAACDDTPATRAKRRGPVLPT